MKFTSYITKPVVFAAVLLAAVSCMTEQEYDCPSGVTLSFSYTMNPENTERLLDEVDNLVLYIFDENDHLYSYTNIATSSLSPSRSVEIEVEPGNYSAVAWGNLDNEQYIAYGQETSRGMGIGIATDGNGHAPRTTDDLFHGMVSFGVAENSMTGGTVGMVRNTNNINILLHETGTRTIPGSSTSVRITGSNGSLTFDNNTASQGATTYLPDYGRTQIDDQPYMQASFKVMRLRIDDDTTIEIYRNGMLNKTESLTSVLTQYFSYIRSNEDLDRYSDYTFVYGYDAGKDTFVLIGVQADDWSETPHLGGGI